MLIDEIRTLENKLKIIDSPNWGPTSKPPSIIIIEASFWARCVLEIVGEVDLHQLGHRVKTNIRTVHGIEDPDNPGSSKAVYKPNGNVSLKKLLGFIVHFRYFSFGVHADGNHCLDVMSDQHVRTQVFYSDFLAALKSLVLSDKLAAAAICELTEQANRQMLKENYRYEEGIFSSVNFHWVLWEFVGEQLELKRRIFAEIFGIDCVPTDALVSSRFFVSRIGPSEKMVIGFTPAWQDGQAVFSPSFKRELLFDIIKAP